MGNLGGKYKIGVVMTAFSLFIFAGMVVLSFLPLATLAADSTSLTILSIISKMKDSITEFTNGHGVERMAAAYQLGTLAMLILGNGLLILAGVIYVIEGILDLTGENTDLARVCMRMVRYGGFWLFSTGTVVFYQLSEEMDYSQAHFLIGVVVFLFAIVCMVVSMIADMRVNPGRVLTGRILALVLFAVALFGIWAMQKGVLQVSSTRGSLFPYTEEYYGQSSVLSLPEKTGSYLVAREADDSQLSDNVNLIPYGTALAVICICVLILFFAYLKSLYNFAKGVCFKAYSLAGQIAWSVVGMAATVAAILVFQKMVLRKGDVVQYLGGGILPFVLLIGFVIGTVAKNAIDMKFLERDKALESMQNGRNHSVHHYAPMMGDKPMADEPQETIFQSYHAPEKKTTAGYSNSTESESTRGYSNSAESESTGGYSNSTESESTGGYSNGTESGSGYGSLNGLGNVGGLGIVGEYGDAVSEAASADENKKILPQSRICVNCGTENFGTNEYCSVCRKKIDD